MMQILRKARNRIKRFATQQNGTATIEIVLILPVFMTMFLMSYEGGRISTNHVMLERGLDLAVRDVRIGKVKDPSHAELKKSICDYAKIIPECLENLQLEMIPMDIRAWNNSLDGPVLCVNREEDAEANIRFTNGQNNKLMVLQVCSLFDPVMPTTGFGKNITKISGGAYALVATSAFVMEPFQ